MTGYDGRGTRFPLTIVRGADLAFELVVTDSNGAAVNVSAATIAGELYTTSGTLVDTMTAVVSGAGSNVITLSFTDTETAAFTAKQYQWSLTVTRGADKRPWLAGRVKVTDGTSGGTPTSGTQTLVVDSDLTVNVTVGAASDALIAGFIDDPASATTTALAAQYAAVMASPFPDAADVTDGTYVRETLGFRALSVDPNLDTRVWGVVGTTIGYRDITPSTGALASFVSVSADPFSGQAVYQMTWTASYVFFLCSASTSLSGQLWRSPHPPTGSPALNFAGGGGQKMFDLTGGTTTIAGGVDGGVNSYFRSSCFAVDSAGKGLIIEYGDTITGGPSVYYTGNVNAGGAASWTKRHTFTNGKHGHAVAWVLDPDAGVTCGWATIGDGGFTDLGVWTSASNGASWVRRSRYGFDANGNYEYGIKMLPTTIDSTEVVLMEYDGAAASGPLIHPTHYYNQNRITSRLSALPELYTGSMRGLIQLESGDLMWIQTGENNTLGEWDSVWIAKAPYTNPVLLERFASANTLSTISEAVECYGYVHFGNSRVKIPAWL